MARAKRSSAVLQAAEKREAGMQSINPDLNLGSELTLATYSSLIQALRSQLTTYNSALSNLDDQARQIKETEKQLRSLSEQMLLGVAVRYGKNSREYGKAGGVPKDERRRPSRKKSTSTESLQPVSIASTNGTASESVNGDGNRKVVVS